MQMKTAILLVLIVGLIGCAHRQAYTPFKVDEQEFYQRIDTIALASVSIPNGGPNAEDVKNKFQDLISDKLREAGYHIIAAKIFSETWDNMSKQIGGIFDNNTGEVIKSKRDAIWEDIRKELEGRYKADAIILPAIYAVQASFRCGIVTWDEAMEYVWVNQYGKPGSEFSRFLSCMGNSTSGTTSALSLGVTIIDMKGNKLYENQGGIQVLNKLLGGSFLISNAFRQIPDDKLFSFEDRNNKAVETVLKPILEKRRHPGTEKGKLIEDLKL
jgi:hypothetical protein